MPKAAAVSERSAISQNGQGSGNCGGMRVRVIDVGENGAATLLRKRI